MDRACVRNFGWLVARDVAGSGLPADEAALSWLTDQGIRIILSLIKVVPAAVSASHLDRLHIPIVDFSVSLAEKIDQAIEFITPQRDEERPVLGHCSGGHGRTGTILGCYLVATGWIADAAIARVREGRPGSLETDSQVEAVRAYARRQGGQ